MDIKKSDTVVNSVIANNEAASDVVEYLLELERKKYELLKKNGSIDYEAVRSRLRSLEADIAGLTTNSDQNQNGHVVSDPDAPSTPLKWDTISDEFSSSPEASNGLAQRIETSADYLETSNRSIELKSEGEAEHEHVRRSSLQSTGSKEKHPSGHSRMHRRLSLGSQPLFTMPNAFQYGIKLRDTKMNGMSMFEEVPASPDAAGAGAVTGPTDKYVQGSRERATNIRSITDKLADSLNGTDRGTSELRKAMNSNEITNRVSFSVPMTAPGSQQKQRVVSTDMGMSQQHASSLAKALLSGGGHAAFTAEEAAAADLTLDSIDAPKRHSLFDLAEAMEDAGDGDGAEGDALHGEALSDRSASETSSAPEGAIEFCIVEADWTQLHLQSQRGHLLTPLLPPHRSWRYPMDLQDSAENNTKDLQDQSFFFPSGVKVDLVWPSVAALRSKANRHIRHIVPFTDAHGKPTYACVLTVTQTYDVNEIAQLGDLILPNLVTINRQKQSALCIQKAFRQFIAYRKMLAWQHKAVGLPKPVAVDSPVLMRSSTIFGRLAGPAANPSAKDARLGDSSTHGSAGTGTGSASSDGPAAAVQSKRTWTSFFSRTHHPSVESMDGSVHGRTVSGVASGDSSAKRNAVRSSSITGTGASSAMGTPTQPPTAAGIANRRKTADATTTSINVTAAELAEAAARRQRQQEESQAEYIRRRVAVAQKAYCIISSSREYTYIFKVLDAIAAAEGFTDAKKQSNGFGNTLSSDDEDSDDGHPDNRSSTCSSDVSGLLQGASPVNLVLGTAAAPFTAVSSGDHPLSPGRGSGHGGGGGGGIAESTDESYNLSPALTTPSKATSLIAAMESYYHQFRQKRDEHRNEFLQEAESFLLEHLTAAPPTALQQIVNEFALSPGAAVARSAKFKANRQLAKLQGTGDAANSPILPGIGRRNSHGSASTHTPSPRGSLSQAALAHAAASRQSTRGQSLGHGRDAPRAEPDLNNRFAHYTEAGIPTVHHIRVPGYIEDFRVDLKALLTTKEWTCSVLLTHLNSTIIFKIINLLLMEKSIIIHGKNAGIVTTITMAVINLVSPFLWEGIFVPLVPDNARELFGAPVPLIVGTTSAPRVTDVSSDTAILFLNDDNVTITTYPDSSSAVLVGDSETSRRPVPPPRKSTLKFVAWFVRLPEVSADLPSESEMCRRIDYTSALLCDFVKNKIEYKEEPLPGAFTTAASANKSTRWSTKSLTATAAASQSAFSAVSTPIVPSGPVDRVTKIVNTIDSVLMAGVPLHILHQVRVLTTAIKRFNYGFCGCVISDPGSWKRFLRHSNRTGEDEFYPEYFMEPLRNHLEFQDAIVHTQLFVSFMDKLRKEQGLLDTFRRFIADWVFFRFYLRNRHRYVSQLHVLLDR